jgi:transposase
VLDEMTDEIEALAHADEGCQQLITVPGIGPIISSAMVAAIGNGAAFCKGRDFAAWLGLVPKQMSTGDRTILGRITKRGNRYLRMLFIQGRRASRRERRPLRLVGSRWFALSCRWRR